MSTRPSDEVLEAIRDLMDRCSLKQIEYHEISGRLSGASFDPSDPPELDMELRVQHRCDGDDFGIRLAAEISSAAGTVSATVAAVYEYVGEVPTKRALFGFGNEVAVMTVFPFLRETVHSVSMKVFGFPILLAPITRGDVGFDLDEATDEPAYVEATEVSVQ